MYILDMFFFISVQDEVGIGWMDFNEFLRNVMFVPTSELSPADSFLSRN